MIEEFRAGLARAAGCVTDQPLVASPSRADPPRSAVSFAPAGTVAGLRRRHGGVLGLFLRCDLEPTHAVPPRATFHANLIGYAYQIVDAERQELLALHWHPEGISPVTDPHLHLTGRVGRVVAPGSGAPIAFGGMHIPTGVIPFVRVVRLLIEEFAVEPRRPDWRDVLAAAANETTTMAPER